MGALIYEIEDLYYEELQNQETEHENHRWFYENFFKFMLISNYYMTSNLNGWGAGFPLKTKSLLDLFSGSRGEENDDFDTAWNEHLQAMREKENG